MKNSEQVKLMDTKNIFSDKDIYTEIKRRWDRIAKPIDGMGLFENLVCRIGAIQKTTEPDISKRCAVIFCSDNGVVEEGISQSGQEVTYSVSGWMGRGESSVCRLAKASGTDVIPVDIGMASPDTPEGVLDKKISRGTKNFLKEPAMTKEECRRAIDTGMELAKECKEKGYGLIASGEMGIGNTTTSAALGGILLGDKEAVYTGRGAGLDDDKLKVKRKIVLRAEELYGNKEPFEVLCSIGGFDVAGLTGLFIGGAKYGIPVIIDGAISAAAAMCAEMMYPGAKECMIPSHIGKEPLTKDALGYLGLDKLAVLHADMALGEGTGAAMLIPLLDQALEYYNEAFRFDDTDVGQYERFKN